MNAGQATTKTTASTSGVATKRRPRRVLIVDDHPIVRQGLRRLIDQEEDLDVCAEAETVREARAAIREHRPDAIIVDISLKQGDGLELVRDVRAQYPTLPILVLSMHDETIYAERMLDGGIYVSETVSNTMIQRFTSGNPPVAANPIDRLSNREIQILHLIGKGLSTRETAEALDLSIKTVESHRQRIKKKLTLTTGTQLVQYAVNWFSGRGES
jgi:DNA-binding NarL/FixJ family response regulator